MRDSYESLLKEQGFVLIYTRGVSMEPMLHEGKEQSLIRSVPAIGREPEKYDVVLFKRGQEYVLHRIVGRKGDLVRIRGDNCYGCDLVKREEIHGILAGFYRGDRYVDCETDRDYLRYARRRCLFFPYRWTVLKLKTYWKAVIKRIKK